MRTFSTHSALQSHINRNHTKSDVPDTSLFGCHVEPSLLANENFFTDLEESMSVGGLEDDGHGHLPGTKDNPWMSQVKLVPCKLLQLSFC